MEQESYSLESSIEHNAELESLQTSSSWRTLARDPRQLLEKGQEFFHQHWPQLRAKLRQPINERWQSLRRLEESEFLERLYENPSRASVIIVGGFLTCFLLAFSLPSAFVSLAKTSSEKSLVDSNEKGNALEKASGLSQSKKLSLALQYLKKKKPEAALAIFEQLSSEATKKNAKAIYYGMASAYVAQKDYSYALGSLFRLNQILPRQAETEYRLGVIFLHKSNTMEARNHFQKAIAIDPQFPGAKEILNQIDVALAQSRQAPQNHDFRKLPGSRGSQKALAAKRKSGKEEKNRSRKIASASSIEDQRSQKSKLRRE